MPTVKTFNDSSSVSVAYTLGDGTTAADFGSEDFTYLPYTTEGFQMSKEAKTSTAIRNDRRTSGSKNTKGAASGSVTVEFGAVPFVQDMLALTLMSDWAMVDDLDAALGTFITDSDVPRFMCIEKTAKSGPADTDVQYHERYYGTAVNDATLEFGDGELVTLALNTNSATADYAEAEAGADGLGGSLANDKIVPDAYEIADSSNNLTSVVLKDDQGATMEVVFSSLSLQIQNNVREQSALGHEFSAGIGIGKVAVSLGGEIYFYDQTVLAAHMDNKRMSAEMEIATAEGTYTLYFPNLMAQAPTNNSQGENQDYKTNVTLSAESGEVTIGAHTLTCCVAVKFVPTP